MIDCIDASLGQKFLVQHMLGDPVVVQAAAEILSNKKVEPI